MLHVERAVCSTGKAVRHHMHASTTRGLSSKRGTDAPRVPTCLRLEAPTEHVQSVDPIRRIGEDAALEGFQVRIDAAAKP